MALSAWRDPVAVQAHSRVFDPHNGHPPTVYGVNRNALVLDTHIDPLSGTPAFGVTAVCVARRDS
ncbi:MAG: hypothetical protein QOI39_3027 [Mycobacterium sp.]|jgi:hypothetical protein|nr:hypothetical protein [Mycobacterium sp.]